MHRTKILLPLIALAALSVTAPRASAEVEPYFAGRLVFGEFDGPRFDASTNVEDFETRGLALAAGLDFGPLRIEAEYQGHTSQEHLFQGGSYDEVDIEVTSLNVAFTPVEFSGFRPLVGAGFGRTRVGVDIDDCHNPGGCAVPPNTHESRTGSTTQYFAGVSWQRLKKMRFALTYRRLRSEPLGFQTDAGVPYAVDELKLYGWVLEFAITPWAR